MRLPRRAERATLAGVGPSTIRTPEHLLAALLFFPDESVEVHCDAQEPPGLDGSALPFREALAGLFPAAAEAPAWREYDSPLVWDQTWDGGGVKVRPASSFSVTYAFDRAGLRQDFRLENSAQAWAEILPARTFAFHREWREARENGSGLMAGAGADSGLLLAESETEHRALLAEGGFPGGPYPLLNQDRWRMENELAKHKILDLLGDLALNGLRLPRLALEIRNGGHRVNHLLLDRL
jgi:UDP-3-O-acyl-N-acetylglucosamine deacetylase